MTDTNIETNNSDITFFFGAGAEGSGNYDIRMGGDFAASSIYTKDRNDPKLIALSNFFSSTNLYYNQSYKYRKDTLYDSSKFFGRVLYYKTLNDERFFRTYHSQIQVVLYKKQWNTLVDDLNYLKEDEKEFFNLKEEIFNLDTMENTIKLFDKAISGMAYTELKNKVSNELNNSFLIELFDKTNEGKCSLNINVSSALLDSYFHTIINPKKLGPGKFSKIFNYYWTCYFMMIEDIMNQNVVSTDSLNNYKRFSKNPDKRNNHIIPDYTEIIENISDFTKSLYSLDVTKINERTDDKNPFTYYYYIFKYFKDKKFDRPNVVTTNYFKFCEIINDKPVYLNGSLKQFEMPETLDVVNISTEPVLDNKRLFFPFIWVQSYVKPIVHSSQIEEYSRLKQILDETRVLIILGYNINEDDNHINAFLHEYVKDKNKQLIVVSGTEKNILQDLKLLNNRENKTKKEIARKLRFDDNPSNIIPCLIYYNDSNKENVERIMEFVK